MPWCKCHSFESLEARTVPVLRHADIAELVTLSALEFVPEGRPRADGDVKHAHNRVMKLQEDLLRKVGDRLQKYEAPIRADCLRSQREWNKYE